MHIDSIDIILIVIYCAGGTIRGMTRLQKILFLLQQEAGLGNFNFVPYKFGPFSREITSLVNTLVNQNLLTIKSEAEYNFLQESPVQVISLTEMGRAETKKTIEKLDKITLLKVRFLVRRFVQIPLTYLIAYVYAKYPEYTTLSEIGDLVREWRDIYGLRIQNLPR